MSDDFFGLSATDRRDALEAAAEGLERPPHLLEKDFWVVWTCEASLTPPSLETSSSREALPFRRPIRFGGRARPRWRERRASRCATVMMRCDEPLRITFELATEDDSAGVRIKAVKNLTDENQLSCVSRSDENYFVRSAATARLAWLTRAGA